MAASRRLQGEIDRCLKKVAEGVEQFEDIWKKFSLQVHNANNTNQKEKYEADLKKEIKKLQRLRDQIKSWLTSAEIKDKTQLLENRKLIETQMERFKVVERETKTKAYSKEGLGAAQNKDPAQREKEELNRWLNESIDSLTMQVDQFECEIEALLAGGKKKKMDKDKSDRIEELKEWLERHRYNIKKLEILMRMLNNESIDCDNLRKIKDDVDYYVESNQDPDFMENEELYDDIEMEDLDYPATDLPGVLGVAGDGTETSTPSPSVCGSSPAPSPASSHTTASSVSSSNNNNNSATMTAAAVVVAAAAAAAAAATSPLIVSTNSTPSGTNSTSSSSSSNSSINNGTSAVVVTVPVAVNATALLAIVAVTAPTPSAVSATTTAITTTPSQQLSTTPTVASVVLNNHSNSSSSNSNPGGGSSSDQHHHNNADSAATTNNCTSTNNTSSGGSATPSTNHSINNTSHHTIERSNKRINKEESRTPVKPTVVRPNAANNSNVITKGSHTPSKPVQGSTSVSTPNNSSTSSGMSYLAASQHNSKNSATKSKEDHNSHMNQNSAPAIINHVATQLQQQQQQQQQLLLQQQQQAAAAAVAVAAAAAQQQLAAQQQQQQQQQAQQQLQQQQQQQQQSISSATANGPLLHASHHPHLHNKVLNSTDSTTASLKNIAQKKLNEVSHHTSQVNAAAMAAAAAAAVASSGAGAAALAAAAGAVVASSGVPAASTASAAVVSSSSLSPAVSATTAAVSSVTGVVLTSAAPPAPMGEAHIPQLLGVAPLGMTPLTADNELQFKRLQAAYYHMPHLADSERLRIHFPRQPVTTPPHFPQVPPPLSDTVDFFQRLSTETLFFIFYYLEGTKAQYLAAKALKKQSWRFHTKYMMWFQRHEEPKAITDEYEQGTYIFFDYDNWGQRKKENFTFEYRFLEDRDLN